MRCVVLPAMAVVTIASTGGCGLGCARGQDSWRDALRQTVDDGGNAEYSDVEREGTVTHRMHLVATAFRLEHVHVLDAMLDEEDMVGVFAGHAELLAEVTRPGRLVSGPSVERLMDALDRIPQVPLDFVAYNPEVWATHPTPASELEDLQGAVAKVRKLAEGRGARVALVPDKTILAEQGEDLSRMVDMLVVQAQRYQLHQGLRFEDGIRPVLQPIREAAPTLQLYVQLFIEPPLYDENGKAIRDEDGNKVYQPITAEEVLAAAESIADLIDGVVITGYSEDTFSEVERLLELLGR